MSWFSIHYLIQDNNGLYWDGLGVDSFSKEAITFHSKGAAEKVRNGLLKEIPYLRITEDE